MGPVKLVYEHWEQTRHWVSVYSLLSSWAEISPFHRECRLYGLVPLYEVDKQCHVSHGCFDKLCGWHLVCLFVYFICYHELLTAVKQVIFFCACLLDIEYCLFKEKTHIFILFPFGVMAISLWTLSLAPYFWMSLHYRSKVWSSGRVFLLLLFSKNLIFSSGRTY